jgi:predicted DNA-binding protein YlxM (UPF0122 family)
MEKIVRQSLLYDFYGELLTEHQKSIYEDVVMNDLSYSEIAKLNGISRQGVFDMIKRCDKILEEYEEKLKLVERFQRAREMAAGIENIITELKNRDTGTDIDALLDDMDSKMSMLLEEL